MKTEAHEFFSDEIRLDALVHYPDDASPDEPRAVVIVCSGGGGTKEWVPSRWWPQLVSAGYICVAFDYRGHGTSDGDRGQMFPLREVDDLLSAVTFAQQLRGVAADRVGVIGWGMGGGVAIEAAARDSRIRAVCCAAGFGDGGRVQRQIGSLAGWYERQDELAVDRVQRVLTGKSRIVPWYQLSPPPHMQPRGVFVTDVAALPHAPAQEYTLATVEAIYSFRPELVVHRIAPRPFLVAHGTRDAHFSPDEAQALYDLAAEPKDLFWIEGGDHLEWIHPDDPLSGPSIGRVVRWFEQRLPAR